MEPAVRTVVEAIHATPTKAVLLVTGGASQALGWLLSVPGASRTVLEATVPYARRSLTSTLGKVPSQFTSAQVAEDLALTAYNRALKLIGPGQPIAGVGCTCALASDRPKKGEHRCYVAARTQAATWQYSLDLCKGARDRVGEDTVSSLLVLKALADASGVATPLSLTFSEGDTLNQFSTTLTDDEQLEGLLCGEVPLVTYPPANSVPPEDSRRVVLSGSFNPLHHGHTGMMEAACRVVPSGYPCYELSATNVDKPPLPVDEIKRRARQFTEQDVMLAVTDAPLFGRKANVMPDSTFVVGVDTAERLFQPKYYDDDYAKMIAVLSSIRAQGCDFIVAGRVVSGVFKQLTDLEVPPEVADMFKAIPESEFRQDISSTELRARLGNKL